MGKRRLAGKLAQGAFGALTALSVSAQAFAQDTLGRPVPGGIGFQASGSDLRDQAAAFHDYLLLPIIVAISLFVLALLLWCMIRYNKRANPTPSKFSHNTTIEVVWTVVPVLILMVIAVWSFNLLGQYHRMPTPDVTVKATGYQWRWGYEYPDQQIPEISSSMLPEDEAEARDVPFRLAATEPMVVPVNSTVRVLTTGADVIHAFGVPAFGIVIDAIPGRTNETWFNAREVGTYYGQCRELCGIDHAFMPIEIKVVTQAEFDAWTIEKGGMTAAMAAAAEAAAATAEAAVAAAAEAEASEAEAGETEGEDTTEAGAEGVSAEADAV
jgi:cytochrome c oxidase subunit 2